MKKIFLTILVSLFAMTITCEAQSQVSRGDQLFAEGQALQKKGQNTKAIQKYKAAKVAYTTDEKKQLCDTQIELCMRASSSSKRSSAVDNNVKNIKDFINVQSKSILLSEETGKIDVNVNAPDTTWTIEIPKGLDGEEAFVSAIKTETSKGLSISAVSNTKTLSRHQSVYVKYKETRDTIDVVQSGKQVSLRTSENLVKFKLKGGDEKIDVITNSDSLVSTNNNECWYVESKPDWIEVSIEAKKEKSGWLNKVVKKATDSFHSEVKLAEDEKSATLVIYATKIQKNDPEYNTGRRGEIVIASQSARQKIVIMQQ